MLFKQGNISKEICLDWNRTVSIRGEAFRCSKAFLRNDGWTSSPKKDLLIPIRGFQKSVEVQVYIPSLLCHCVSPFRG